jgi:ribonuclease BN (tRNA processing enzyme)
MRSLTVLGSCAAYPEPERACSGFLVEWDDFRIVLDLGYGTLPPLLAAGGAVDAVVITHEHPDHCIDLHGLFRMLYYGGLSGPRVPLFCPPGVLTRLAGIEPDVDLLAVFDVRPLPGHYRLGPFELTGRPLPHFVPSSGVRLQAGAFALAYTGDTGPTPTLATLGRDASLFIVEATDRPGESARRQRNLLTAAEAGAAARAAGAQRLLLTHFWPGTDRLASLAAARAEFDGAVLVAEEGLRLKLDD